MKEEASQSWIAAGGALLCFFYSCPDSQLLFWKDLLSLLLSCRQPFVLAFESMLDSTLRYCCCCYVLYSIMMSIWMYELVQKTLANTETLLCAPKNETTTLYYYVVLWTTISYLPPPVISCYNYYVVFTLILPCYWIQCSKSVSESTICMIFFKVGRLH